MRKNDDVLEEYEKRVSTKQLKINEKLCRLMMIYFKYIPDIVDFENFGGVVPSFEATKNRAQWLRKYSKKCCEDIIKKYEIQSSRMIMVLVAEKRNGKWVEVETIPRKDLKKIYGIIPCINPHEKGEVIDGYYLECKTIFTFQKWLKKYYPKFYSLIFDVEREELFRRMNPSNFM